MGSLHARVITQAQDATVACIVDPFRATGEMLAERFRCPWFPELDNFGDCDAVIVATPTATHVEYATRALDAGRAVLVEKPLTDDLSETEALVERARSRGTPLTCGLLERFNPAVRTALSIIDEPLHVTTVRHSPYVPRIVTGVAHDLLIHDVDLALRIAGALPDSVAARFGYFHPKSDADSEDVADALLKFDPAPVAALSASRLSQRKIRTLVVAELERLIEVDLVRNDVTVYRHVGNSPLEDGGAGYRQQTIIDIPTIHDSREPLAAQLERFIGLARGEIDADEELATLLGPHQVIDQIQRAGAPAREAG
jgi:predicted dehydrogenase